VFESDATELTVFALSAQVANDMPPLEKQLAGKRPFPALKETEQQKWS
jgi:hypothetical protein